ncbi:MULTISPECIES: N-acetyltransferase [unclassified Campylobacter]|uniref:N-acetyltransferase n=1 Tax=unclassified Campylobacter TaxID=2593542 RepID=UPI001D74CE25|nr:N-acetyltransferase [Campylobacter sp. IFREMER_LSEM_CL2194]EGK7485823.1 N-acetyltransferase [Campylobacter lari]MCR8683749.1 N-acetyltransferase [Campylobacter sp. LMG 17559]MCR8712851.1 N-acetyltransferase [Campylobacter sp. W0066.1]EGK8077085.1 N-acetyltransferase [Campylobacter lari]EGK8097805.1 N-acetyltransferase [Campylobacter lari]
MKQEVYTSKFYICKKNEKEVCFKLDFEIKAFEENQKFYYVEICAIIDYQYLKNELGVFKNDNKKRNYWKLKYMSHWSFSSCVEIDHNYKSLGIGTFVINKILEIALSYVPEANFHDILSKENDENEESCKNRIRRDKLYKNLGFIFNENNTSFSIDSISDLKIRKDFDYIQEVRIFDMCNQLAKLQYLKEGDDKLLQYCKDDFNKEKGKNNILRAIIKLMSFVSIALAIWIVYLLK